MQHQCVCREHEEKERQLRRHDPGIPVPRRRRGWKSATAAAGTLRQGPRRCRVSTRNPASRQRRPDQTSNGDGVQRAAGESDQHRCAWRSKRSAGVASRSRRYRTQPPPAPSSTRLTGRYARDQNRRQASCEQLAENADAQSRDLEQIAGGEEVGAIVVEDPRSRRRSRSGGASCLRRLPDGADSLRPASPHRRASAATAATMIAPWMARSQ